VLAGAGSGADGGGGATPDLNTDPPIPTLRRGHRLYCSLGHRSWGAGQVRTEARVELLGRTRLFAALSEPTLRALAERSVERTIPRHSRLFHQGDPGTGLFVLVSGLLKVVVTSEDGEEMVLVTLGPGEALGELSTIDGGPRSASAEALEPTVALMITRPVLLELAARDRALTEALLQALGGLLRRLTEQASDLVFLDLPGRMAKLLAGLAAERGSATAGGIELDAALTQTDLAGMVGASRQSVNQILQGFARRGYLQVQGRRIVVHRLDLLRRRAGLDPM
jgi:CRP/FNR family transcriptional regulator, cyclic AMP receptor protein